MSSSIGIDVDAPPELVFALALGRTGWERLLPPLRPLAGVARGSGRQRSPRTSSPGGRSCRSWRWACRSPPCARTWSDRATASPVSSTWPGRTKGMDVTWRIEPAGGGTHITHRPRLPPRSGSPAPLCSPWRMLATFKALARRSPTRPRRTIAARRVGATTHLISERRRVWIPPASSRRSAPVVTRSGPACGRCASPGSSPPAGRPGTAHDRCRSP